MDEKKPLGYSWFPGELIPAPVGWVERTGRLVSWKSHEFGGHFAAVERPEVLLGDVVEFVGKVLAERGYEK